ncbi:extracellular solute-binding protein [Paenibacillus sp. HWE-109]|uniref:extracellular solute-binding protein n=1 Tax=Paenibacillus sp. HWE-109 TaxID=1306526 RepID=UPI001EDE2B06|nr:extracellular solute-binding protein [Paenibacillus sp. HWE-109]UKS27341.1 extracellular solute-binding protein [Paenibacillus sp. HWE-109]
MSFEKKWGNTLYLSMSAIVLLSACSSGNESSRSSATPNQTSTQASVSATPGTPAAPVKIRVFETDNNQPVPGGKMMDDPTIKYLAQKTNTDLDWVFLPHGQFGDQVRIKFASGDIPDVVQSWGINYELLKNNQVIPLNDYINKYGSNLKKAISQAAWDEVTIDGKILAIPEGQIGNKVLYVRKDWMDKVGITTPPKTPDELLTMLRAFRDKDPNGNGKKDEMPFSGREKLDWVDNVITMFGADYFARVVVNGEVVPGLVSPNMKQALGFLRTLVEEKLIDSEFLTNKRNVWEQKIQNNLVGAWVHAPSLSWDWQDKLNKSLPGMGANVIAIPTPKAPGVESSGTLIRASNKSFMITKAAKDPAAIVKMLDWLASQEGQEFVNFGIPNVTYKKDGDKINYDSKKDADDKTVLWRFNSFNLVATNKDIMEIQLGSKEAADKMDSTYKVAAAEGIKNIIAGIPPSTATPKPELEWNGTLFQEAAAQILLGKQPLDYFDTFVKQWRAQAGTENIKYETDYYNSKKK